MTDQKNKKLQKLRLDLTSEDEKVVLKALTEIKKHGDGTFVEALLNVYRDTRFDKVKQRAFDMLNSLKVSSAEDTLVQAAQSEEFLGIRSEILSFLWNSGMYPSDYILDITRLTVSGDYMVAVEGITLIENMEGPFQPDQLEEALFEINQFIDENPEDLKIELIQSLQAHMNELVNSIDY